MRVVGPSDTGDEAAFHERWFRRGPLLVMSAATCLALVFGPEWSTAVGPLPWCVSLVLVGLPHGAADWAASRQAWHGWGLAAVWLAYIASMAAITLVFAVSPPVAIAAFTAISCWHFGTSHLDTGGSKIVSRWQALGALARGCVVLAAPLIAWPDATAEVATDLATLAVGQARAADMFPSTAIWAAGVVLAALAVTALGGEMWAATRGRGEPHAARRLLVEMIVIAGLGWSTDPLFSVGLYFLAWHAWRQMEPLAESLAGAPVRSCRALEAALVRIHAVALPLLVPTWAALGGSWWLFAENHTPRTLAVVSIATYLIVTPAHEMLAHLRGGSSH